MPMRHAANHIAEIRERVLTLVDGLQESLLELEAAMITSEVQDWKPAARPPNQSDAPEEGQQS